MMEPAHRIATSLVTFKMVVCGRDDDLGVVVVLESYKAMESETQGKTHIRSQCRMPERVRQEHAIRDQPFRE